MRLRAREQGSGIREQSRGRLIVLPKVWAVADAAVIRTGEGNTGVSPVPRCAAPVEMTARTTNEPVRRADTGHEAMQVAFYRKYTEAMLRRYAVMLMESGRVPSMLGREMFRGKVTSYRVQGFDDAVIFRHDVESCMKRLSPEHRKLLKRIAVQQYTYGETAAMFGMTLRTCIRRYNQAVDGLTAVFMEVKLLEPLKSCQ